MHAGTSCLKGVAILIKHMLCCLVVSSFYGYYMVAAVLWPLQCVTRNQYNNKDCPRDQSDTKFFCNQVNFYSVLNLMGQTDQAKQNVGFGGADVSNTIG